jgi:hypothetical protein
MHLAPWSGVVVALFVGIVIFIIVNAKAARVESYDFGDFEKLLGIYLDISKFIVSLAAGGIVLVVGSSVFSSSFTKRLPPAYAAPLFVLAVCIFYGILFMVTLITDYEEFRNFKTSYKRARLVRNNTFGYSSLVCFCIGYAWLIAAAVWQ